METSKIAIIFRYLPFYVFLLCTINIGISFEYSPLPAALIFLILLRYFLITLKVQLMELILLLLIFFSLTSTLVYVDQNTIKESIFFMTILSGFLYAKVTDSDVIKSRLNLVLTIYLFIAFSEILVPGFSEVKAQILTRSYYSEESLRGVSSLLTEPSFFALSLFSCWLIYAVQDEFRGIDFKFTIKILIGLALTKSSMIILIIPCVIIFSKLNKKMFVIYGFIFTSILLYFFYDSDLNFRAINLLTDLISNGLTVDALDDSASARLFYIIKDFKIASQLFFFPTLNGSYEEISKLNLYSPNFEIIYDPNLSGSLFGRFIVEFGFVTVYFSMHVYIILWRRIGMMAATFLCVIMLAILFQMISMIFYPVAFSLGVFLYFINQSAKCRSTKRYLRNRKPTFYDQSLA